MAYCYRWQSQLKQEDCEAHIDLTHRNIAKIGARVMRHKKEKYDILLAGESRLQANAYVHKHKVENEIYILHSHVIACADLVRKCNDFTTRTRRTTETIKTRTSSYNNMKMAVVEFSRFVKDIQTAASMGGGADTWLKFESHIQGLLNMLRSKDKDFGRLTYYN